MSKWVEHDKSLAVNLYLLGKMLKSSKEEIADALEKTFAMEKHKYGSYAEFVNEKRKWVATCYGLCQYY